MISKGGISNTYRFPNENGIPTKISITSISPESDSKYRYIAGEP